LNKKRILYIESNLDGTIGGSYYSLLYLLEGLNKELYDPYVLFCQDNILIPKFKEVAKAVIINNYDPSVSNNFFSWKTIPRLIRDILLKQFHLKLILNQVNPDLIHLNNGYTANHEWMLACRLNNIRIVAHDRGDRLPATLQTRFFVRFLDATISVSDAYKNIVVEQGLKPKRIRRVYNGLDTKKFRKYVSKNNRQRLREELRINQDTILVGMVGNIDYWKGQLVFVKALHALMHECPHIQGIIVGNTPKGSEGYEEDIQLYLKANKLDDRVKLLGFRHDVPQLLNAMDIFVHASVEPEPFGRVILEAMAMGKPVIATKPGGPCEIIEEGITGYLVPMNDHIAVKDAILRYVNNPCMSTEMGIAAKKVAEIKFSVSQMVEGVEKVYDEIFNPKI
jgi:glycosyltransferase involved in cell wall biosynthesis